MKLTAKGITVVLLAGLTLASCRKKELPVTAPDLGDITTTKITMTPTYEYQIYFDFSSNSNKGQNNKTDWDLGFSCGSGTPYIITNSAKVMMAGLITDKTFEEITSTSGFNNIGKADNPAGLPDSLAIRGGSLFILDRGMDGNGNHQGHFKMEIISHTNASFTGRFANINGSNEQTITIQKDDTYNFVYMKWNNSSSITTPTIEPAKEEWDLVFTQYVEIFNEPTGILPYSVVGCLTNTYNTTALHVTGKSFEEVDLTYAESLVLSNHRNAIGYNWKTFLYDQNIYQIHYEKVYVIKDNEGYYYKMRFIDFYNEIGEKGTPTFEFQRL